ncbi:hypothetical protein J437_LFUL011098 [Ladona fulva]|uniref:Mariner Mos1 transposase n=1 Tax=Ladona fulva TaxID=123851 RepID=A0A8K0KHB0_LADFU|nr:hypothetical protein J437_LFUL011098 [Ladona fulva]
MELIARDGGFSRAALRNQILCETWQIGFGDLPNDLAGLRGRFQNHKFSGGTTPLRQERGHRPSPDWTPINVPRRRQCADPQKIKKECRPRQERHQGHLEASPRNAPSHTAFLVRDYLTQINVAVIPQPPYSPDVAPSDFFLFPYLKRALKGRHLESIGNIRAVVTRALKDIPEQASQDAFRALKSLLQKCIEAEGCYFEEF